MFGFLKKILGSKSEKDIKEIQPIVDKANSIYSTLSSISNEELRAKVTNMRKKIKDATHANEDKIQSIKQRIENDAEMTVDAKESLYKEVDELEKEITKQIEEVLKEIQAEAFAVCKETARRFTEKSELVVDASEIDHFYLARRPNAKNVIIENGKAIWKNTT